MGPKASRRDLFAGVGAAGVASALAASPAAATDIAMSCDWSGDWKARKKYATVHGRRMAWVEMGEGDPILFLHGNPTSSYLWRNVIPHVAGLGRCIAPDLIGQGDSDKLPDAGPGAYSFLTHREYLLGLMEQIGATDNLTLVVHDWGSGLGLDYAANNPGKVKAIAYMEAILRQPDDPPADPANAGGLFGRFLSEEGEELILEDNMFVEQVLFGGLGHYLTEEDKAEYRRPFLEPGAGRWPTLEWPRQLPAFNPETAPLAEAWTKWLVSDESVPKLLVNGLPGAIFSRGTILEHVRKAKNQSETTVYGAHFLQESGGHAIGRAIAEWLRGLAG